MHNFGRDCIEQVDGELPLAWELPKVNMKKAPSEDLFRLIKSLTKGEKRNFKLLAGLMASEKDKKYIELFDIIDKQEAYNEAKVAKLMQARYKGQLSVGKHYLYNWILKSLVHYNDKPYTELADILQQVRIMEAKDLYHQAKKLLRKGIKLAEEQEDFAMLRSLLEVEMGMLMRSSSERNLAGKIEELEAAKRKAVEKMNNLDRYEALTSKFGTLKRFLLGLGDQEAKKKLEEIENDPLIQSESAALSKKALNEYYVMRRKICGVRRDFSGSLHYTEAILANYDQNPFLYLSTGSWSRYYFEVYNLCIFLFSEQKFDRALDLLESLRLKLGVLPNDRVDFFSIYFPLRMIYHVYTGDPNLACDLSPEIEAEWILHIGKITKNHELNLLFWLCYSNLEAGQIKAALKWSNRFLQEAEHDLRIDLQADARLVNLLIHIDLGNFELVDSEVVNVRRFMEKYDYYGLFQKQFLKCVKAIALATNTKDRLSIMKLWAERWNGHETDTKFGGWVINIEGWLNKHITGMKMGEFRKLRLIKQLEMQ